MSNLAQNLKNLRKSKGLNQRELSKFLNISQPGYAKYENNLAEPDIKSLKNLANFYGVSIDYLLDNNQNFSVEQEQMPAPTFTTEELKNSFINTLTEPQQKIINIVLALDELQQLKALSYLTGLLGY